jgi:hypothetical protein
MLTMRPNFLAIMPSTVSLIMKIGPSMLLLTAEIHAASSQSRKLPVGGPPALLIRMSGSGQSLSTAARPSSLIMSAASGVTLAPVALRISSATASMFSRVRATMVSSTPSLASDKAQALPSPALAPPTMALRPAIPKSILSFSSFR